MRKNFHSVPCYCNKSQITSIPGEKNWSNLIEKISRYNLLKFYEIRFNFIISYLAFEDQIWQNQVKRNPISFGWNLIKLDVLLSNLIVLYIYLIFVGIYQISSNLIKFHPIWSNLIALYKLYLVKLFIKFHQIWWISINFCQNITNFIKFCHIWLIFMKSDLLIFFFGDNKQKKN